MRVDVADGRLSAAPTVRVCGVCDGAAVGARVLPRAVRAEEAALLSAALRLALHRHFP